MITGNVRIPRLNDARRVLLIVKQKEYNVISLQKVTLCDIEPDETMKRYNAHLTMAGEFAFHIDFDPELSDEDILKKTDNIVKTYLGEKGNINLNRFNTTNCEQQES